MKTLKTLGFSSLLAACVAVGGGATAQPYQKADDVQDMALIYQGGSHRLDWTADEFRPYVVHRFADGTKDWLFDGFLFLEFKNGSGRHYTVGYEKLNARKGEWAWLLDRIFEEGKSLSALDQCITEEIAELGKPDRAGTSRGHPRPEGLGRAERPGDGLLEGGGPVGRDEVVYRRAGEAIQGGQV